MMSSLVYVQMPEKMAMSRASAYERDSQKSCTLLKRSKSKMLGSGTRWPAR